MNGGEVPRPARAPQRDPTAYPLTHRTFPTHKNPSRNLKMWAPNHFCDTEFKNAGTERKLLPMLVDLDRT